MRGNQTTILGQNCSSASDEPQGSSFPPHSEPMLVEMVKDHVGGTLVEPNPLDSEFYTSPGYSNVHLMMTENDIIHPRGRTESVAMTTEES